MNNFAHNNPGESLFQGSDLANIQVNNDFQDDNEDDLDTERLQKELKFAIDLEFNESGANTSVISDSSDASEDELESNRSHSRSIHNKSKSKKSPVHSNAAYENAHFVNTNFQPDFHRDGSYPSPILPYSLEPKGIKHIPSNEETQAICKKFVYEGVSNETNYDTLHTMYEIKRNEVNKLEKELTEFKMKAGADIDNLRKNLLISESEGQRAIMEYQEQCEILKKKNEQLEKENFDWKHKVEAAEKSNAKLSKELDKIRINKINLEEQCSNLSRSNASKQYDTNVDFIVNDLKKKHSQEVGNIQEQYKNLLEQIKSKDRQCTLLTNELKKLQQEHHHIIVENNNLISNLTKELNATHKDKTSNSNNYGEINNLSSQLMECSKQNQKLNSTLQQLTAENDKLRSNLSASHVIIDKHNTNDINKLEEDYHKSLELLQKHKDDVKNLTEMLNNKERSIAEMEKKEVTYKHCMYKIQQELEKYSRDKSHSIEHSNQDCEALRNVLEMQLEDTMCKLIRTEEDMTTLSKRMNGHDKMINTSSIAEYLHYHEVSLENAVKQKDEEIEKLKNRMDEYVKEIDELKQLYVKVCSEKEHSLNEKEELEKHFKELSFQFETVNKQLGIVVKEKEELAINLIGIQKEISAQQDPLQKQLLEKEIEDLKKELMMRKCQKEMIAELKIQLSQSKDRISSLDKRLQSECSSKVSTYVKQLEKLKNELDEKENELKQAKDTISKLTNSDLQIHTKVMNINEEKTLRLNLADHENLLANIQRNHKLAMDELTYKYKNELNELEMLHIKKCNEEKLMCAKMIEDLKSKHRIEIETLNTVAKQNTNDYASQELIEMVAEHEQQFNKAREMISLKNNTIRELELKMAEAKTEISLKNSQLEQLKKMQSNVTDINTLKEQIEEERNKFAQIMTNWALEMRQMKDKLSTSVVECEKLRTKYVKVKQAALCYKHANHKQELIYNELLVNCVGFLDELKTKTYNLLTDRENEIQLVLKEFENDCKQRRLAMGDVKKISSFNTS